MCACVCACVCICVSVCGSGSVPVPVTLLPHLLSFNSGTFRSESSILVFSVVVSGESFQVVECYIFCYCFIMCNIHSTRYFH